MIGPWHLAILALTYVNGVAGLLRQICIGYGNVLITKMSVILSLRGTCRPHSIWLRLLNLRLSSGLYSGLEALSLLVIMDCTYYRNLAVISRICTLTIVLRQIGDLVTYTRMVVEVSMLKIPD